MLMNALHAMPLIIVNNLLMEILLENVYVKMDIMMISKIIYVNNVLNFGL